MADAGVVVIAPDALRAMIREEVEAALKKTSGAPAAQEYLKIDDVARVLQVTPTTVRAYVKGQGLPATRIGTSTLRFERAALETWIRDRATKSGGHTGDAAAAIERLHGLVTEDR